MTPVLYKFLSDEDEPNVVDLVIRMIVNASGNRTPSDPRITATVAEIYLTSLIMRHHNPNKVRISEAFDRLTSGVDDEKL
ncbi:hypothetical protein [Spirosoma sp. KNUC1025]|uniref:hypothetical protein n=1 Tax=Spirosoma sp. KNUC1025 TaxID=2894082 RepID=UPI00386A6E92|nr:hypothetical protein LN737_15480 [Spirosoma sp. KNUC1025]